MAELDKVVGFEEPKRYVHDRLVDWYKHADDYKALGVTRSKGMLLYSIPGVGKTMFMDAVKEDIVKKGRFFYYNPIAHELMSGQVGGSSEKIHSYFAMVREQTKSQAMDCVLFLDEVDLLVPDRNTNTTVLAQERTTAMLVELDGMQKLDNVFIIAATNRPEAIDDAFLRGGRIQAHFEILPPNLEQRKQLLHQYLDGIEFDKALNLDTIASFTNELTGSDFVHLKERLGIAYVQKNKEPLSALDLTSILDSLQRSKRKKGNKYTKDNRKNGKNEQIVYNEDGTLMLP
jgi:ATP-dependent 26S proteasome regulatory subunit